jgi:SCP-2 sterol transfer family
MQHGIGSLRGAIGTPDQVADLCRRYESVGVDQVIFVVQAGRNRHEHICESIELFGKEVVPRFAEGREEREGEKAERLRPAVEAALARRRPAREAPPAYLIDEEADIERARRSRRRAVTLRGRAAEAAQDARERLRRQGQEAVARLVRGASDATLERRFGSQLAQRAIFIGMARQFDPRFAFGFEGDIVYELRRPTDGARPRDRWTIRVDGDRASAIAGGSPQPALTLRFSIPDFVRLLAEEITIQELLWNGRFELEGDLHLASRIGEMFGQGSQY